MGSRRRITKYFALGAAGGGARPPFCCPQLRPADTWAAGVPLPSRARGRSRRARHWPRGLRPGTQQGPCSLLHSGRCSAQRPLQDPSDLSRSRARTQGQVQWQGEGRKDTRSGGFYCSPRRRGGLGTECAQDIPFTRHLLFSRPHSSKTPPHFALEIPAQLVPSPSSPPGLHLPICIAT